jgi:hypothetical protein
MTMQAIKVKSRDGRASGNWCIDCVRMKPRRIKSRFHSPRAATKNNTVLRVGLYYDSLQQIIFFDSRKYRAYLLIILFYCSLCSLSVFRSNFYGLIREQQLGNKEIPVNDAAS